MLPYDKNDFFEEVGGKKRYFQVVNILYLLTADGLLLRYWYHPNRTVLEEKVVELAEAHNTGHLFYKIISYRSIGEVEI